MRTGIHRQLALLGAVLVLLVVGCAGNKPTGEPVETPSGQDQATAVAPTAPVESEEPTAEGVEVVEEPTIAPTEVPSADWQRETLGTALNRDPEAGALLPSLAVGPDGRPVAVWLDGDQVVAGQWDGSAWKPLGDKLNRTADYPDMPALAVGPDNSATAVWTESGDTAALYAARWDGKSWAPLGDRLNQPVEGADAHDVRVIATSQGPVVAWTEGYDEASTIVVQRWDGAAWQALAGLAKVDPASNVEGLALAALPDGSPLAAWKETGAEEATVHVRRWDQAKNAWTALPDPAGADFDSALFGLGTAADGSVFLSLSSSAGLKPVQRWTEKAGAWSDAGLPQALATAEYIPEVKLAVGSDGSLVLVAGTDTGELKVWREAAGTWSYLGSVSAPEALSEAPSAAIGTDGTVYVAWQDVTGDVTQVLAAALQKK